MSAPAELSELKYDDAPAVALFGYRAPMETALKAIAAAGARAAGPFAIEEGAGWTELAVAPVLWLEMGGDPDEGLQAVLDELRASASRWTGVVAMPEAQLDAADWLVTDPAFEVVVGGSALDRRVAIELALGKATARSVRVHEGNASEVDRLRRLTDEVGRIAQALAEMSDNGAKPAPAQDGATRPAIAHSGRQVRAIVRARRLRDQFFQPEIFADPAWDMLLDLYAAHLDQHRVAVSSLCIASAVPATTALRWIKTMTDHGLFVRRADPTDGRRVFIELSAEAASAMDAYFGELERQAELVAWNGRVVA